jgi:hypothetical protein
MKGKVTFILLFAAKLFAQVNLSSSLIACYSLDGDASEPVNNLTGILGSVTPTTGHIGIINTAYHFNGDSSSYINYLKARC